MNRRPGGRVAPFRPQYCVLGRIGKPPLQSEAMRAIGRFGQLLGLGIPAFAIILELNHRITLGQMLMLLVAAVCCFWIGRIVEGLAGA
jgi:hypothetical protein